MEKTMETPDDKLRHLQKFGAKGYTFLSMRYIDVKENAVVVDNFKRFALSETDDNYIQALKKLLEYYQADMKYQNLLAELMFLKHEVELLKASKPQKEAPQEEEEDKVF
jgi:hypothetical protein